MLVGDLAPRRLVEHEVELPESLVRPRPAIAVEVQADPSEVERKLDLLVADPGERGLRVRQVISEGLQDIAQVGIADRFGMVVGRHRELGEGQANATAAAVAMKRLREPFHAAEEPGDAQADPRLGIIGVGLEDLRQGRVGFR